MRVRQKMEPDRLAPFSLAPVRFASTKQSSWSEELLKLAPEASARVKLALLIFEPETSLFLKTAESEKSHLLLFVPLPGMQVVPG
jgi:hypothetical protein